MTRARNLRLIVSLLLAVLAVVVSGVSVLRKVQSFQPIGFEQWVKGSELLVFGIVDPASGLEVGDKIQLGEGSGPELIQRLREQPTSQLSVLRDEGGPKERVEAVTYHRPPLDVDFPFLILALTGAVYLLIGLYTLLRQREGGSFLFYLWCLASAMLYLMAPVPPADEGYRLVYLLDVVARILVPPLMLHLFLVFPSALPGRWSRRAVPFLYLPAAALLTTLQADMAFWKGRLFVRPTAESLEAFDQATRIHLIVFVLAAVAVLVLRLTTERDWEQRRQLKWMTFGIAGYVPFLALYLVPYALNLRWPELVTTLFTVPLAVVPLTFAYAILRYKLWDIEVLARNAISWTLTLLLGVIGFSLVNLAIDRGVSVELGLARNLLSFVSGLAIAGLLVPTRSTISSVLERLHYRTTYSKRRALSDLGRELLLERDLGRLCGAMLRQIEEAVDLDRMNLYLVQGGALQAVRLEAELPPRLPLDALGTELWQEETRQIAPDSGFPCQTLSPLTRMFVAGYRSVFPLTVRGRGIGLVLASSRHDGSPLNSEDTALIRHLLNQAALAIENAQLMGQLHLQLEEVQRLQHYTEGIFESSPAGIAVLDGERRVVSANAAFAALACADRAALIGRSLESILPVQPLPAPGEAPVEVSFCEEGCPERHLQLSLAVFEPDRSQGLYVLVVHDVSERVAMENALKEKDRLAALGLLAAGVAHEVNTPITGISSYAQMLLAETSQNDPHYEILKKVERQTFRAASIVNNLLEFARNRQKDQKERKPVTLAPLVTECLDLLGDQLGRRSNRAIEIDWTPPSEKALVLGSEGELQQVFTNLIVNAVDAMRETGGRVTIGIEASPEMVVVRVKDTGAGISPEKLERIFQPFYSTKLNRGGTGLGLSISHDIVRRHGGELKVASTPGEGACFSVELPRHVPSAATASA
jgi:signal transduction histidine kinase